MHRIGLGYDFHRFSAGRRLVLGGVEIPGAEGLLGHSDADVVLHALCDALLGALALGDIGIHFPDHDPQYKGIASRVLLRRVWTLVREKGFLLCNLDIMLIADRPKLAVHYRDMRKNIANELSIAIDQVSIKATTQEGCAADGISAQAIVLLASRS